MRTGRLRSISTTDEHPFHVADTAEWTRADGLIIGDRLSTMTGTALLEGVLYTTERVPVYNLSIPGSPTYFVGEHGVWVHNCPAFSPHSPLAAAIGSGARIKNTDKWLTSEVMPRLERYHGANKHRLSENIHHFKGKAGLGGADNVYVDLTGNVYHPTTGELMGSLLTGH